MSQQDQDKWIYNFYKKKPGFFVDVGFHDGEYLSNTNLLELNGWRGIGIDPFPKNFSTRNKTIIYKEVLYDKPNIIVDFSMGDIFGGVFDDLNSHKNKCINKPIVQLKTTTLEIILDKAKCPKFIEYLTIDTEGSEYKVLSSFNFNKYSFGCICVEHNFENEKRKLIRHLLQDNGYKLYKEVNIDDWYINNSLLIKKKLYI